MKGLGLLAVLAACAAPQTPLAPLQPERQAWQARLSALDPTAPLVLRYNPADCNCPAFELALGEHWLRAEVAADETLQPWLAWLASAAPETWPIPVQATGRVGRTLLRTETGAYGVRIDRLQVIAPIAPVTLPAPVP